MLKMAMYKRSNGRAFTREGYCNVIALHTRLDKKASAQDAQLDGRKTRFKSVMWSTEEAKGGA